MGKWQAVIDDGRSFSQWIPTSKGERMPEYDVWDGCPICGASPLPNSPEDVRTLKTRLKLTHYRDIHESWAAERRSFSDDVGDVRSRMQSPTEPEAA